MMAERPGGHDEHEDGGQKGEEIGQAFAPEPEENDDEGEAAEQLVHGTEEWPKNEAAFSGVGPGESFAGAGNDGDAGCGDDGEKCGAVAVGEP